MNRGWAGFGHEDWCRAGQITIGILDEDLTADLGPEYLPVGGRRIGGLADDLGIARIDRNLTAVGQEIKDPYGSARARTRLQSDDAHNRPHDGGHDDHNAHPDHIPGCLPRELLPQRLPIPAHRHRA